MKAKPIIVRSHGLTPVKKTIFVPIYASLEEARKVLGSKFIRNILNKELIRRARKEWHANYLRELRNNE